MKKDTRKLQLQDCIRVAQSVASQLVCSMESEHNNEEFDFDLDDIQSLRTYFFDNVYKMTLIKLVSDVDIKKRFFTSWRDTLIEFIKLNFDGNSMHVMTELERIYHKTFDTFISVYGRYKI